MKWSIQFLTKLEDKALQLGGYNITRAEIEKKKGEVKSVKGKKKEGLAWYIEYPFIDNSQYEKWLEFVEKEVRKINPKASDNDIKIDVDILDMLCCPSQPYLFKKESTLF